MRRRLGEAGLSPILLIILVVLGMGLAGYMIWRWQRSGPVIDLNPGVGVTTEDSTRSGTAAPDISPTIEGMPAGWEVYESVEHGFKIAHPPDVLQEPRPGEEVRFVKFGPTQQLGTELYDGISVSFDSGQVTGEGGFEEFVRSEYVRLSADPGASSVSDFGEVTVGAHTGYAFRESGLGEFTHVYLPKAGGSGYVHIVDSTVDPTDQGFVDMVRQMLDSLVLP